MATYVDIDDDTLQAVGNLWKTAGLVNTIGPLQAGDLKGDQAATYAQIEVVKGKTNERMSGGLYHDYRSVTITIRGRKDAVSPALARALAVFNLQTDLTMPSGARFVRFWPMNDGGLSKDTGRKGAEEIWKGVVTGEVWTVRTDQ